MRVEANEATVPGATHNLLARAMADRRQVVCLYDEYPREFCPIVLGHSKGQEVALVCQFAGASRGGLPPEGEWKCLRLAKMEDVRLRDGPWRAGTSHRQAQSCVEIVDLDVNPESPYQPRRRVSSVPSPARRHR